MHGILAVHLDNEAQWTARHSFPSLIDAMALSKSQLEDAQILGADASLVTSDQHLKKIKAMALRSEVDLADISKDIEEELLNASLDMYQYGRITAFRNLSILTLALEYTLTN